MTLLSAPPVCFGKASVPASASISRALDRARVPERSSAILDRSVHVCLAGVVPLLAACSTASSSLSAPSQGSLRVSRLPAQCGATVLSLPPPSPLPQLSLNVDSLGTLSGEYVVRFFLPPGAGSTIDTVQWRVDITFHAAQSIRSRQGAPLSIGSGVLYGDLRNSGLSVGSLAPPSPQTGGLGYHFEVWWSTEWKEVSWGLASGGLDSGLGFKVAAMDSSRIVGWWYDGAVGGKAGVFCAMKLSDRR